MNKEQETRMYHIAKILFYNTDKWLGEGYQHTGQINKQLEEVNLILNHEQTLETLLKQVDKSWEGTSFDKTAFRRFLNFFDTQVTEFEYPSNWFSSRDASHISWDIKSPSYDPKQQSALHLDEFLHKWLIKGSKDPLLQIQAQNLMYEFGNSFNTTGEIYRGKIVEKDHKPRYRSVASYTADLEVAKKFAGIPSEIWGTDFDGDLPESHIKNPVSCVIKYTGAYFDLEAFLDYYADYTSNVNLVTQIEDYDFEQEKLAPYFEDDKTEIILLEEYATHH